MVVLEIGPLELILDLLMRNMNFVKKIPIFRKPISNVFKLIISEFDFAHTHMLKKYTKTYPPSHKYENTIIPWQKLNKLKKKN